MKFVSILNLIFLLLSITASAQKPPTKPAISPCQTPEHRQFDFWLGDWQVRNKEGVLQGTNKIHSILDGCVISENWLSAKGNFSGKSVNFYDKPLNQWHQTWIDNQGGVLYLTGNLQGKVMVLQGQRPAKNGATILHKISYTPLEDGQMEQKWQTSSDDGKNWQQIFLGYYRK